MSAQGANRATAAVAAATTFPVAVAPDRRRLLDATGRPVLIQGDAAWSLIANTTLAEAERYLDARQAQGFNAIIVSLIERLFSADPPRNRAGDEPFTVPGDFRTPGDAYMAHAERVLVLCRQRGMLVFLAPTYLGYHDPHYPGFGGRSEGWNDEVLANGSEGCRAWGEYLGRRFGHLDHLVWMIGGDRNPGPAIDGLVAAAEGLRATGVRTPMTAHVAPEHWPVDEFPGQDWLDLNLTYTYGTVHTSLLTDWRRDPPYPYLLIESTYEGEHDASALQIRRQAYWSVLCGGNGHCMGNKPMWLFEAGWQDALASPGAAAMTRWGDLFRSLPWSELRPDLDHALVTGGLGEARGLDRTTAAISVDGAWGMAYLPSPRPLEVDVGALAAERVGVSWFEPLTGRRLDGGVLVGGATVVLMSPLPEDAVLLLEAVKP